MKTRKVALITGAAGGLGQAMAHRFYQAGYHLMLADIDQSGLEKLKTELEAGEGSSGDVLTMSGDLTDMRYAEDLVKSCRRKWNRLDVLINNAIWRTHDTLRTISEDTWEKTIRIGLTAPAFLTRWAAALMEERAIQGTIVNITSIQANRSGGTSPAYVACKGALDSLTYESAALYGAAGIRVVGVAPGNIQTALSNDFVDDSGENISHQFQEYMEDQTALNRSAAPMEIANVAFWVTTDQASFVNGTIITVDGGFSHGFGSNELKNKQNPGQF